MTAKKITLVALALVALNTYVLFKKESEFAKQKIKNGEVILVCSGGRKPTEIENVVIGDEGYWYITSVDGTEDVCKVF